MAESQMDRSLDTLSMVFAEPLRARNPEITDNEIKEAAHRFAEFIRILRAIDAEQKHIG